MAKTPETSEHTSIRERILPQFTLAEAVKNQCLAGDFELPIKPLLAFDGAITSTIQNGIPYFLNDYLQLVDWSGRAIRNDKRGYIPSNFPPILARLNISPDRWLLNSQHFEKVVHRRFRKSA